MTGEVTLLEEFEAEMTNGKDMGHAGEIVGALQVDNGMNRLLKEVNAFLPYTSSKKNRALVEIVAKYEQAFTLPGDPLTVTPHFFDEIRTTRPLSTGTHILSQKGIGMR